MSEVQGTVYMLFFRFELLPAAVSHDRGRLLAMYLLLWRRLMAMTIPIFYSDVFSEKEKPPKRGLFCET